MSRKSKALVIGALAVLSLPLALFGSLSLFSRKPENLGVTNGHLADCPATPNCVSSQATDPAHRMDAISFNNSPEEAMSRLKAIIANWPRTKIVTSDDRYIHAEFTSLLFRFVDDVEFLIDPATKQIHFRSASRTGKSDLGVNRQRMTSICEQFAKH